MARVKHAASSRKRRKRTLDAVKGQRGSRSKLLRTAKESERKSKVQSYIGRKLKKRTYRALWITRITAACKAEGISYSKFISGLKKDSIELNRKVLADLAVYDIRGFKALVKQVNP